jgi:hypothetical protein
MTSALRRVLQANAQAQATPQTEAGAALQQLVTNAPKTTDSLLDYEANISRAWIDPDPAETDGLFRDMIENTVSGALKAAEAVQRADKQLGVILGQ